MKKIRKNTLAIVFAMSGISTAQAVVPVGTQVTAAIALQGGTNAAFIKWAAPLTAPYKVHVFVPSTGITTNSLYRVYPKGKRATATTCVSTDLIYPCYEISIDQTQHKNAWTQLTLNSDAATRWEFVKAKGYVTVAASNLATTETLNLSAVMRFENMSFPTTGYSKISNNGAFLPDSAVLGTGVNNWACTRDNVTKLTWEVKTDDTGLRDKDNTYSWYDPNPATNGGLAGYQNYSPTSCTGGISCDTDGYVKAVNTQKLCGFSNWKMPSQDQLLGLVNTAYIPTINPTYFPNTPSSWAWSSSPYVNHSSYAWIVNFYNGYGSYVFKSGNYSVRLVRGGQ